MKKLLVAPLLALALALSPALASSAWAHSVWVNAFESFAHPPGHALVSVAFGHKLPMDDLLTGAHGTLYLDKYELVDPAGKHFDLPMPDYALDTKSLGDALAVSHGDIGANRIEFGPESLKGTYVVNVETVPTYVCKYVNTKGKPAFSQKPLDQVDDIKNVEFAVKYYAYSKGMFSYMESGVPEPLGHDLEINPKVDVAKLHAGDLLPLEVTFLGKPLSTQGSDIVYITATSNTFGGPDNFMLMSYLMGGKARFRLPTSGQWLISLYFMRSVEKCPELADLKGKTHMACYAASLTLEVKP